jgi:hypothetical protein
MRSLVIVVAFLLTTHSACAAQVSVPEPELEVVPGPEQPQAGLPDAATWPVRRHQQPLRLLAVLNKGTSLAPYRRIALRLQASLDVGYVSEGGDERYHVNDKWIEPNDPPSSEQLIQTSLQAVTDLVRLDSGRPQYDVIFVHGNPRDILGNATIQQHLLQTASAGGILAVCGSVYLKADSPLASVWPAKPLPQNSWMSGGAKRDDGPEASGVPVERLSGHTWIPLAAAADGARAIATGESGAVFLRKVGSGAVILAPTGPSSRFWSAIATHGRKFDHDEIWLRLWDQLLHETKAGAAAFPAYGDLRPGEKDAPPNADYVLPGKVVNRAVPGPLAVAVHVTTPQGTVVYGASDKIDVPVGSARQYDVGIPVPPHWPAGLYPVYLSVGDTAARQLIQQSLQFIPVAGQLSLTLAADKRAYRLGESATFTVVASSRAAWSGELAFGVYDFRGRLLAAERRPAQLTPDEARFTFSYRLDDHGVRVDTLWATVAARVDGRTWGRAEAKVYKYEPWSMRNEYQWSTWAGLACASPSQVPAGMRLMAHAGMNALGYPGRNELHYPAERWGWRYYNEGIGMNTFSPVIEYENDGEIEAALRKEAERSRNSPDLNSAAFVLGSVGEEAGFKRGWGTRYYWDTPVAPDKACRALQWFLQQKYARLNLLNAAWKTNYAAWGDVKLTKEFSGRTPDLGADGWARPKDSPLGAGVTTVSLAPYADTAEFYNWYYDRIVGAARRILRKQINPVTLTMSSAPTIGSADYDVRQSGPGAWNESQWHAVADGPEPGFGLIWGHFDWSVKTDNMFWGFLLMRSGHNNYWVDVPLMFNNDLTHTRSSFAMRRWTQRLAGHERIILDSRPPQPEVELLGANGLGQDLTRANMATSLQVALSQGGFGLAATDFSDRSPYKIVFAIGRQAVSQAEADRLQWFVENGGVLVFTPRFASQTELGVSHPHSPGCGLAEKWGFRVTERTERIPQYHPGTQATFALDGVADRFRGLRLSGHAVFREKVQYDGWTILAKYDDGTPGLLTRTVGKGRLFYLNAVYQSHHYIQWVTPTGPERQGFFRLAEWLCEQAGATRTLRIDGDLSQTLHMAVKQFTDPSGHLRYVLVRTSGEVPWVAGKLNWQGPQTAGYDVLNGDCFGRELTLNLKPGAGRFLAFVPEPIDRLRVEPARDRIAVGQPLEIATHILSPTGRGVAGRFPLELRVSAAGHEIAGLRRSFSAASGERVTVNTALSDPPGVWTIRVTDGISGRSATANVDVEATPNATQGPGFVPWGWPSELEEPARLSHEQFLAGLRALAALYRQDHTTAGWMAKQRLGYHYDFFPGTRHAVLRPLLDVDWPKYVSTMRRAVTDGETLVLTGEDLGVHPGSGLATHPHHDAQQLEAIAEAFRDAQWSLATADGDTLAASLGQGRVILCRESIDAAGHDNPSAIRWQQRFLAELARGPGRDAAIPAPSLETLRQWWTGRAAITARTRTVTWLDGNLRQLELALDGKQSLGALLTFMVPPTGDVQEVACMLSTNGPGRVKLDVGCDGVVDGQLRRPPPTAGSAAPATDIDWTGAVRRVLAFTPYRDDSGWRLVPVRVTADDKVQLTIRDVRVVVR